MVLYLVVLYQDNIAKITFTQQFKIALIRLQKPSHPFVIQYH